MKKSIWVAGGANMDVVISLARVPERGESVIASSHRFIAGGKGANRAVALARLGANPVFSCCLGEDDAGNTLAALYEREGVNMSAVERIAGAGTGTAYIFVERDGSNRIAIYSGANDMYSEKKAEMTAAKMASMSMLSLELEIPVAAVERLIFEASAAGVPCVVDAGPVKQDVTLDVFRGAYILSPNETEAFALTGVKIENDDTAKQACRALYGAGVKYVLIKLGEKGSVCYDGDEYSFCPAFSMAGKAVDTTAAGDCYMAGLCFALERGSPLVQAMRFGSVAAGICVTREGAIPSLPYGSEVNDCIRRFPVQTGIGVCSRFEKLDEA